MTTRMPVAHAVVRRERQGNDRARSNGAIDDPGAADGLAEPDDGHLRRIDDPVEQNQRNNQKQEKFGARRQSPDESGATAF